MTTTEESVVNAMDGSDKRLFKYLPYILQDTWEFGATPDAIIELVSKYFKVYSDLKILDLGCGKGAVSVKMAKALGCQCYGLDAVPEFIEYAKQKASEFGVSHLCKFQTGDIREEVKKLSGYHVIILGAIGPVLGDYYSTLTSLSNCVSGDGIFIIDDGYIDDNSNFHNPHILRFKSIVRQIDLAGMELIGNNIATKEEVKESDNGIFENIKKRCNELAEKYPENKTLFLDYIKKQGKENEIIENQIICSTMLVKRKG